MRQRAVDRLIRLPLLAVSLPYGVESIPAARWLVMDPKRRFAVWMYIRPPSTAVAPQFRL